MYTFSKILVLSNIDVIHKMQFPFTCDAVFAVAQLDKKWKNDMDKPLPTPNWPPQSHLVNARTRTDWYHENDNKIIQGQMQYFSQPITLVIGKSKSVTYELSQRIDGHYFKKTQEEIEEIIDISFIFLGFAMTCVVLGAINYFKAKRADYIKKHGDNRPSSKPYAKVFGDADEKENGTDVDDDDDNGQELVNYPHYTDYTDKVPDAKKKDEFSIHEESDEDSDDDEEGKVITL